MCAVCVLLCATVTPPHALVNQCPIGNGLGRNEETAARNQPAQEGRRRSEREATRRGRIGVVKGKKAYTYEEGGVGSVEGVWRWNEISIDDAD